MTNTHLNELLRLLAAEAIEVAAAFRDVLATNLV